MNSPLQPRFCYTASAYLIVDDKILLVKHKKLGVWLSPGGHMEDGELPHQAAEREFFEETGIKVKTKGLTANFRTLPPPFKSGLHWVCEENFERRKKHQSPVAAWSRGCEQHFDSGYLVEAVSGLDFKKNIEETDGIAWFRMEEIDNLETFVDVKDSIKSAFKDLKL